jgi:hypothetical protein
MKLIVLAYTSKNYMSEKLYIPFDPIQSDRADLTRKLPCMDTWVSKLKDKNIEVIFFDGDNPEVSFDEKNQILHLTETDTYDYYYLHHQKKPSNMVKKLQGAITWLLKNREFDYILRVDDGTYVNSFVLEKYFNEIIDKDIIWSGQGGGGGIFFSKKICEEILNIHDETNHLEDATLMQHFSKIPEVKFHIIDTMSAFYNLGEKNLTIHYSTCKRMYYCDFIISNYYNNLKTNRKVILNYEWSSGIELNTNRVSGTEGKTGAWYGLDRDKNNWEYYGGYARSISDIYDRTITYGDEVIQNLCVFNFKNPHDLKIKNTFNNLLKTIVKDGEINIFFSLNDGVITNENTYNIILKMIKNLNYEYEILNDVNFKEYTQAQYIQPDEKGLIIRILKTNKIKKIYIAQYYTSNLTHGPFAEKINKKYCDENGYGYFCEKSNQTITDYINGAAPTWYKPKLILDVIENFDPEYILFLDTDAIISDFNIRIEEFIDKDYNFIASLDESTHSLMNAGVFLIKNNEWGKKFLNDWAFCCKTLKPIDCELRPEVGEHDLNHEGFYSNRLWMDQTALTHLYKDRGEYVSKMKIISNRSFNWNKYNDNNFIFHAYAYGSIKNRTIDKIHNKIFNINENYDYSKLSGLAEKYTTDKHYGHDFFDKVYQLEFDKIKESAKKVVELGVHEGQSINIWREFFTNAEIIGIDFEMNRANIDDFNRVKLLEFNVNVGNTLIEFSNDNVDIDLFIDDGSHAMKDQQVVLAKLFKSIKSGGMYVLEDLHTSVSVKNDVNSIWKSEKNTITLDMLEMFNKTGKLVSDYMTDEECDYLEKNIESCEIFKLKPEWSYTSIIRKK